MEELLTRGLRCRGMPFGEIGRIAGVVMPDHVIDAGVRGWLQQMHGATEITGAVIVPQQALLLCDMLQLCVYPACVLPKDENPDAHAQKNKSEYPKRSFVEDHSRLTPRTSVCADIVTTNQAAGTSFPMLSGKMVS
jgi:hypothetical protein